MAWATVCLKLFNAARPDFAVFGEKDFQQLKLVQQMVADLDLTLEVVGCPTVREPDGLALSSRNRHLTTAERQAAPCLQRGLARARELAMAGERGLGVLLAAVRAEVEPHHGLLRLQYLEAVDAQNLAPLAMLDRPARLCLAALTSTTRLIDNVALNY